MPLSTSAVAIILGIVEGLTEFLPISSTGHLIVADHLLRFQKLLGSADKAELFEIVIQLGAILAVGALFRKRLTSTLSNTAVGARLRMNLLLAFLPAAIIGFATHHFIKEHLFSPTTVAISLIIGGLAIIFIEKKTAEDRRAISVDTMSNRDALVIGLWQTLSLIPGTSRAAATIMGGMLRGVKRGSATEFSFLLAFPTMIAASVYELFKYRHLLSSDMIGILALGFITAFLVALVVVAWLVRFVQHHSFVGFGVYRILFGALILVLVAVAGL
jgi:undecaprenyl-diphosphatase